MAGNVKKNLQALHCQVDYKFTDTNIKTRMLDIKSGQHMLRIDDDKNCSPLNLNFALDHYDAIVISDYNKGTISLDLIKEIRQDFDGPIFIDTKKTNLKELQGCIVKINALEYSLLKSECENLIVS